MASRSFSTKSLLFVFVSAMINFGCRPVESRVTPFFVQQPDFTDRSFFVVTGKTTENESLEFRSYAGMISGELQSKGMVLAKDEAEANFVVIFSQAIDDGKNVTSAMPVYTPGQTYSSTTYGSATAYGSAGSVSAYGTSTTYGQTSGSTTYVPVTNTVYTRVLNVRFYGFIDGKRQPVYEVRAISRGRSSSFSEVAQAVIAAAFDELPFTVSGKTVRVQKVMSN